MPTTTATDRPVAGRPDKYGSVKVVLPEHDIEVIVERKYDTEDPPGRVYIETELVEQRVPRVAELSRQEEQLGADRFTATPKANKLYKELNGLIEAEWLALTAVALRALHAAGVIVFNSPSGLEDAIGSARYNPKAGCTMCPCSPGVTAGHRIFRDKPGGVRWEVGLRIQRVRPAAKRKLSKAQAKALNLIGNGSIVRDETRTPFVYRPAGGNTRLAPAVVDWLIINDLVALAERNGVLRVVTLTETGEHERFARS